MTYDMLYCLCEWLGSTLSNGICLLTHNVKNLKALCSSHVKLSNVCISTCVPLKIEHPSLVQDMNISLTTGCWVTNASNYAWSHTILVLILFNMIISEKKFKSNCSTCSFPSRIMKICLTMFQDGVHIEWCGFHIKSIPE